MPIPSIPINPEMPDLDDELTGKIAAQVSKHSGGWRPISHTIEQIYNAALAVLKEEQGL